MRIDLGGIAKGYIADRAAQYLRRQGIESALLNFGGNIVALGTRPDGRPWRIGLQSPGGVWGQDYWAVTQLCGGTIVTSGVYERGFEMNGCRYHHILNPKTGRPAISGVVSVSVRGTDSMTADALATAALVLGARGGLELVGGLGYSALFLFDDGRFLRTPDFELANAPEAPKCLEKTR